jgi:hypothetical protein
LPASRSGASRISASPATSEVMPSRRTVRVNLAELGHRQGRLTINHLSGFAVVVESRRRVPHGFGQLPACRSSGCCRPFGRRPWGNLKLDVTDDRGDSCLTPPSCAMSQRPRCFVSSNARGTRTYTSVPH